MAHIQFHTSLPSPRHTEGQQAECFNCTLITQFYNPVHAHMLVFYLECPSLFSLYYILKNFSKQLVNIIFMKSKAPHHPHSNLVVRRKPPVIVSSSTICAICFGVSHCQYPDRLPHCNADISLQIHLSFPRGSIPWQPLSGVLCAPSRPLQWKSVSLCG